MATINKSVIGNPTMRAQGPAIPREGQDGLFTQSWFPICMSSEIPVGVVKGYGFLDGRVVVYRGEERYSMGDGVEAIGLRDLMTLLSKAESFSS